MATSKRSVTPQQLISGTFSPLMDRWSPRKTKIKEWYNLITQKDELETPGLESVVSNEPRTLYNMALFLLTPQVVPYNIPSENNSPIEQDAIATVEKIITQQWDKINYNSLRNGNGGSWLRYFNSIMLSSGWYAVFSVAQGDTFIADIWNPSEVFPEYSDDGLSEVLHAYRITASAARKKISKTNWSVDIATDAPVDVYDYWDFCDMGHVRNTIVIANQLAKEECHPEFKDEIPIWISPVAGLPDKGSISDDDVSTASWRAHVGESIVATNEQSYKSYNRNLTFMQQIIRDTAQPRIIERTHTKGVVTEENWDKRGAIFHLDTDEDIHTLDMPGMPPELVTGLQNLQGMLQRGGFSYSLFQGNDSSGFQQTLVSAHAQQILLAFKEARDFVISCICNTWLDALRTGRVKVKGFQIPDSLPDDVKFDADIKINIPGDIMQRAATARQLDPDFKLSNSTTMELMFPEIKDPNREIILGRTEMAMARPEIAALDTIAALMEQADALQVEGKTQHAQLYRSFAQKIQQELSSQPSVALPPGFQNRTMNQAPGPPGQMNGVSGG